MIEARRLYSHGIGLTDAHLIASVFINPSTLLWTRESDSARPQKVSAFTPVCARKFGPP
jgi:hypothetical protein